MAIADRVIIPQLRDGCWYDSCVSVNFSRLLDEDVWEKLSIVDDYGQSGWAFLEINKTGIDGLDTLYQAVSLGSLSTSDLLLLVDGVSECYYRCNLSSIRLGLMYYELLRDRWGEVSYFCERMKSWRRDGSNITAGVKLWGTVKPDVDMRTIMSRFGLLDMTSNQIVCSIQRDVHGLVLWHGYGKDPSSVMQILESFL